MTLNQEIVGAFITGILSPIIVGGVKYYFDKKKEKKDASNKDHVAESLKTNILVDNKLHDILDDMDADRVFIMQFHNGGNFYPTGKSIHKFSMFYENVTPHTPSIRESFQNIPVSLFSKSTNHLLEHDVIEISDFKDELIATHGLKYIAEENGTKSSYMIAIKSIDGRFIGILGLDYVKKKKKLNDEQINELCIEASSIGGVLMNLLSTAK